MIGAPTVGGMPREQRRRLAERELRPYRAEDEPAVLALWARALPRWPVSAEAFRSRVNGTEQLVMVADGGLAGYISAARAQARAQLTAIVVDPARRRAGLGSQLLAQARRNLGGGVKLWFAGSGAGPRSRWASPSGGGRSMQLGQQQFNRRLGAYFCPRAVHFRGGVGVRRDEHPGNAQPARADEPDPVRVPGLLRRAQGRGRGQRCPMPG